MSVDKRRPQNSPQFWDLVPPALRDAVLDACMQSEAPTEDLPADVLQNIIAGLVKNQPVATIARYKSAGVGAGGPTYPLIHKGFVMRVFQAKLKFNMWAYASDVEEARPLENLPLDNVAVGALIAPTPPTVAEIRQWHREKGIKMSRELVKFLRPLSSLPTSSRHGRGAAQLNDDDDDLQDEPQQDEDDEEEEADDDDSGDDGFDTYPVRHGHRGGRGSSAGGRGGAPSHSLAGRGRGFGAAAAASSSSFPSTFGPLPPHGHHHHHQHQFHPAAIGGGFPPLHHHHHHHAAFGGGFSPHHQHQQHQGAFGGGHPPQHHHHHHHHHAGGAGFGSVGFGMGGFNGQNPMQDQSFGMTGSFGAPGAMGFADPTSGQGMGSSFLPGAGAREARLPAADTALLSQHAQIIASILTTHLAMSPQAATAIAPLLTYCQDAHSGDFLLRLADRDLQFHKDVRRSALLPLLIVDDAQYNVILLEKRTVADQYRGENVALFRRATQWFERVGHLARSLALHRGLGGFIVSIRNPSPLRQTVGLLQMAQDDLLTPVARRASLGGELTYGTTTSEILGVDQEARLGQMQRRKQDRALHHSLTQRAPSSTSSGNGRAFRHPQGGGGGRGGGNWGRGRGGNFKKRRYNPRNTNQKKKNGNNSEE